MPYGRDNYDSYGKEQYKSRAENRYRKIGLQGRNSTTQPPLPKGPIWNPSGLDKVGGVSMNRRTLKVKAGLMTFGSALR